MTQTRPYSGLSSPTRTKPPGEGGTNTLKPALINSLIGGDSSNMAEWLANLNRQEEGESEIAKMSLVGEEEGGQRSSKVRSGILDKATTNIQPKQVWPQQNLGEDWADEEVEFKQMKFEHLVAGETHHRNMHRPSPDPGMTQVVM